MNKNERNLVRLIKEEYSQRLLRIFQENVQSIFEADMFDKEGNQLLSQGLKVRHKGSGYEYTVDHVEGDGDEAIVFLRHPETPRFKPAGSETQLAEGDDEPQKIKVDQVDLTKVGGFSSEDEIPSSGSTLDPLNGNKMVAKGSLLKISRKEFEKEYEVK